MGIERILIILVLAVVALSLLTIGLFGVRGIMQGKVKPMSMLAVALPVVVLIGLIFGTGDGAQAAVYSVLIMLVVTTLALLLTSVKGLFN